MTQKNDRISKLEWALKRFVKMVEEDQILTRSEDRAELIETLAQANEALEAA